MFTYAKDGIIVASMIDTRKPNSKGFFPIKIRVNQKRIRVYYSTGISISKEDWEKLPTSKSTQGKATKEAHYPFGKDRYEIKKGESHKKALSSSQIKQIFEYTDVLEATEKWSYFDYAY